MYIQEVTRYDSYSNTIDKEKSKTQSPSTTEQIAKGMFNAFPKLTEGSVKLYKKLQQVTQDTGSIDQQTRLFKLTIPNQELFVIDDEISKTEKLIGMLGAGGSKKAILLENETALLLPNLDTICVQHIDYVTSTATLWQDMMQEEIAISSVLTSVGLLCSEPKYVEVALSKDSIQERLPAYICKTFKSLANEGNFIIDTKNWRSSTWREGKDFLFTTETERLNEKNWSATLDPLLTDLAKIVLYRLPSNTDSLNMAIIKKPIVSEESSNQYEVRYFGFDFSSKRAITPTPTMEKFTDPVANSKEVNFLLHKYLNILFYNEFGQEYNDQNSKCIRLKVVDKTPYPLIEFKDHLVEKYTQIILERIEKGVL